MSCYLEMSCRDRLPEISAIGDNVVRLVTEPGTVSITEEICTKVNVKKGSYGRSPLPALPNPPLFFSSSPSPTLLDACHAHVANYALLCSIILFRINS